MATCKSASPARRRVRAAALRGRILSRHHQLLAQADLLARSARQATAAEPGDEADQATASVDSDVALRVLEVRMDEVANLEDALQKVVKGTYGRCESCGQAIPAARLALLPGSRYCIACQREVEREQPQDADSPAWEAVSASPAADAPEPRLSKLIAEE